MIRDSFLSLSTCMLVQHAVNEVDRFLSIIECD